MTEYLRQQVRKKVEDQVKCKLRKKAYGNRLRRPWDGYRGRDFESWKMKTDGGKRNMPQDYDSDASDVSDTFELDKDKDDDEEFRSSSRKRKNKTGKK